MARHQKELVGFFLQKDVQWGCLMPLVSFYAECIIYDSQWAISVKPTDSFNNWQDSREDMVSGRMSRKARRHFKKIQRTKTKFELQEIASGIQTDLDKRHLTYDEALMLGNLIQNRADQVPGDTIVYAISDRDAYRRTLELYLRDALLTRTEQLLLWEERRRLGISEEEHQSLLEQLLTQWKRQGRNVTIDRFEKPSGGADSV